MLINLYRSGKTPKFVYFAKSWLRCHSPRFIRKMQLRRILKEWESRPDADYIRDRVNFYCPDFRIPADYTPSEPINALAPHRAQTVYYYDISRWMRYFPRHFHIDWQPGDVFSNPYVPSIIKARRLDAPLPGNAVIINLNSVRHFLHPHDNIPFADKKPMLLFRGKIDDKPQRIEFFRRWFRHPLCDIADTSRHPKYPEWNAPKISVADHFRYKFVMVLEGNDVSSNLQWVMASNCVPVMSKPRVEHWLMHSRLIPDVHYIEVAPDWSDLEDKLNYYIAHPEEAEKISHQSRRWAQQFFNPRREKIITLLTLTKYFRLTHQIQSLE